MTPREQRKADRREQLLNAGARLIAERGFLGVRLEDLGAAAGISGPAVYRHFPNKDALLVELLSGVTDWLYSGAQEIVAAQGDPQSELAKLVEHHLDFALSKPDIIRIQDRDLANLPDAAGRRVRREQRRYVELWVKVLRALDPALAETDARIRAHAAFGLLNSTPHSTRGTPAQSRGILRSMALAALTSTSPADTAVPAGSASANPDAPASSASANPDAPASSASTTPDAPASSASTAR